MPVKCSRALLCCAYNHSQDQLRLVRGLAVANSASKPIVKIEIMAQAPAMSALSTVLPWDQGELRMLGRFPKGCIREQW
jgi:hypothetical protein